MGLASHGRGATSPPPDVIQSSGRLVVTVDGLARRCGVSSSMAVEREGSVDDALQ